ncbi:MAG: alpha/beta hydrolase [Acidobacteria bacterium]|nr:MAG: alpha/beta hydrolase [Acidobacteriota bacterium]
MAPGGDDGCRVVPVTIPGPAGALEGALRLPPRPAGVAVFAHPHPLHGGTMHTKVVHRAARFLSSRLSLSALRFNFRGVGSSEGTHDEGRGEVEDLAAAVRFARERQPGGILLVGGFSFGSLCAVGAAPRVGPDAVLLVGVPLTRWDRSGAAGLAGLPVAWVQGERDEFGGGDLAAATAARFGWQLAVVAGADHFFTGRLDLFEEAALSVLRPLLGAAS